MCVFLLSCAVSPRAALVSGHVTCICSEQRSPDTRDGIRHLLKTAALHKLYNGTELRDGTCKHYE